MQVNEAKRFLDTTQNRFGFDSKSYSDPQAINLLTGGKTKSDPIDESGTMASKRHGVVVRYSTNMRGLLSTGLRPSCEDVSKYAYRIVSCDQFNVPMHGGHSLMSASLIGRLGSSAFRLSATTVSMSLTGSCFSSESAPRPFHHGIRGRGGTIFGSALSFRRTAGPSGHANSPHPSSREGHHSTAGWSSSFFLSHLILHGRHAAAISSRVHRNSVPSTQMRCMITANRRASATIAFFIPRCLAIFIAQALSQDHFVERTNRIWAAS